MIVYIFAGVFLAVGMYLIVQRIRCNMAVKEKRKQLSDYNMERIHLIIRIILQTSGSVHIR